MNISRHQKGFIIVALVAVLAFAAFYLYQGRQSASTADTLAVASVAQHDSTALHLSVIPSMGSLPFYYAVHSGMSDSSAVRLVLHTTYAQPDADTAVTRGRVDAAILPLSYLALSRNHSTPLVAVLAIPEQWHLVATKQLRANTTAQLKGKVVATTRYGADDYWLQAALQTQKMGYDNVFHPQINAIDVRLRMVSNNQIDAAMLPEPWASLAMQAGCKSLWNTPPSEAQQWALSLRANTLSSKAKREQISQAIALYGRACEALNQPHNTLRDSLLVALFGLTSEGLHHLPRWQWGKPAAVRQGDIKASIDFLGTHGVALKASARTELYTNSFIPE